MKTVLIILLVLIGNLTMAQQPTMQKWTNSWHSADSVSFQNTYSKNAFIFPPNKKTVQGNANILEFMKGGLGKVDVIFEPEDLKVDNTLAFESGVFKDVELKSGKILGTGRYSITWVLVNEEWKILCHTWSLPDKE